MSFQIYVRVEGRPGYFQAFTWRRLPRNGIERALAEGPKFGHTIIGAFAKDTAQDKIVASWNHKHGHKAF